MVDLTWNDPYLIWLKFTINYSLFKLNYNWRHCSAISLNVFMLCVCTKRVCVCNTELVCKAVRMAFSCQTSAIALPFIPIPCSMYIVQLLNCMQGARCDSIYIVQLLYCTFLAVTVFTLYSCWTTGSQLWEYVHYTVIVPAVTVCTL